MFHISKRGAQVYGLPSRRTCYTNMCFPNEQFQMILGGGLQTLILTNRVHCLSLLCSAHSWESALAPRNFTQDVSLDAANLPMKKLFLMCFRCILEAAILTRMYYKDVVMWNRDMYNAYL